MVDIESERFCSQCGRSRLPLNVPHLASECLDCGKTAYFVRTGPDGKGIKIEKGERLSVPAGFIELSLDPASRSKLFRAGMPILLKELFVGDRPNDPGGFPAFIDRLIEQADAVLEASEQLKDLKSQEDTGARFAEVTRRLKTKNDSREWHALVMASKSHLVKQAIETGDAGRAAFEAYLVGTARGLMIVTEPIFEQTLWRGYLASQVVYEAASAASQSPAQAEAIKSLEPLFRRTGEATLFTWVESKQPIGPLIGVKELPEEILLALAKWHLASFQREREETAKNAAEARAREELQLKRIGIGMTIASVAGGAVVWLLNYLGYL